MTLAPLTRSFDTDNRLCSPNLRRSWWEVAACSLHPCEDIFPTPPHSTSRPALSLWGIPHIENSLTTKSAPGPGSGHPVILASPPVTTATLFSAPTPPNYTRHDTITYVVARGIQSVSWGVIKYNQQPKLPNTHTHRVTDMTASDYLPVT